MVSSAFKILEHIVAACISQFLNQHKILFLQRHTFQKYLSTFTPLTNVTHSFASTFDKGGQKDVIFLNFGKTSDCVPHELIDKLPVIGIPTFLWASSCATNRKQYNNFIGETFHILPVTFAILQGSKLGPVLFSIYYNETNDAIAKSLKIFLFGDYCILFNNVPLLKDQIAQNSAHNNILSY